MEAASKAAVIDRLHALGHTPIRVDQLAASPFANLDLTALLGPRRMPARQLALLTSQLATLLHAGLALDEALGILRQLATKPLDRQCLKLLLERISGGATLSDAMAEQPNVFPGFYVSMIRAGEAGASLEAVLDRLSEFLERSQAAREHITSALLYPIIVPIVIAGARGTTQLIDPIAPDFDGARFWTQFLFAVDILFVTAGLWAFEPIVSGD